MNDMDVNRINKSGAVFSDTILSAITHADVSFGADFNNATSAHTATTFTTADLSTEARVNNVTSRLLLFPITTPVSAISVTLDSTPGPENQALLCVSAIVCFYGAVLLALLWLQLRRRASPSLDEELYAVLINREELARRDKLLRYKLNVLRIDGIKDGYQLDHIPEHTL